MSKRLVILKMGEALPQVRHLGDFEDWILDGMAWERDTALLVDVPSGEAFPDARDVSAVVITGSEAMVTDQLSWALRAQTWLRPVVEQDTPVLGICFGHQLLAQMLGGTVQTDERGRELGGAPIEVTQDGRETWLFRGVATKSSQIWLHEAHSQSVSELPDEVTWLARGRGGICQALQARRAVGVQFHPEFTAQVMRTYLDALEDQLVGEGFDVERLRRSVREDGLGRELLRRFATEARL